MSVSSAVNHEPGSEHPRGRRLALDPDAASADQERPAFIAGPDGAPVYHGFVVLEDVNIHGFSLGMITDFAEGPDSGDAFVVAPDGSRAGLVWDVSEEAYFVEACPTDEDRWGVWSVGLPHPMTTKENMRLNLRAILPRLKKKWDAWQERFGQTRE